VEFHSGDNLRDGKEQNHINSQQFSEIPSPKINHQTVEAEAQGSRGDRRPRARHPRHGAQPTGETRPRTSGTLQ